MLRRHPTSITLTQDDIQSYDTRRAERLNNRSHTPNSSDSDTHINQTDPNDPAQQQAAHDSKTTKIKDPSDELKPLPGDRGSRIRAPGTANREAERLGRIAGRTLGSV